MFVDQARRFGKPRRGHDHVGGRQHAARERVDSGDVDAVRRTHVVPLDDETDLGGLGLQREQTGREDQGGSHHGAQCIAVTAAPMPRATAGSPCARLIVSSRPRATIMTRIERRELLKLGGLAALAPGSASGKVSVGRSSRRVPDRRAELYGLLGALPERRRLIRGAKRDEAERDGYVLETWDLDLNGIENVPAYLARPRQLSGRVPGVLFDHSHGGGYKIGKQG